MKYLYLILFTIFIGCGNSGSTTYIDTNTTDDNTTTTTTTTTDTTDTTTDINTTTDENITEINKTLPSIDGKPIQIFTLGPVLNALVRDANNQVAHFDSNSDSYIFDNPIQYPITALPTNDTYVDVDYDNKKTAMDIKPSFTELKSFNNQINLLSNLYFTQDYNLSGMDVYDYYHLVKDKFNIDLYNNPLASQPLAKVLFATYNYVIDKNTLTNINNLDNYVDNVNLFFQYYLDTLDVNQTKYYSVYDSLLKLDKREIQRVDTLHKPHITIVRDDINITDKNSSIDVFDILKNNNVIYTASGHDELGLFDDNLTYLNHSNASLLSFGRNLYSENFDNNQCLYLADSLAGFKIFDISNNDINQTAQIFSYYDTKAQKDINFTDTNIVNISGYVSPQDSKRFVSVGTDDKGFYLINMKNISTNCTMPRDINSDDLLITSDGKNVISTVFRNDGSYVYVSVDGGISGYNLQSVDSTNILASKQTYTLQNNEPAYNLLPVNNDNELFVTTNQGVQVYDIDNSNDLHFISEYITEGSKDGYYPKMDFYNNYLFLTDGYKGLKVIKYDDSFTPMLCGVEYFAPKDNPEELAKVNSVKYYDGYLYVGIDSYGIVKFKMDDILFKHCKE